MILDRAPLERGRGPDRHVARSRPLAPRPARRPVPKTRDDRAAYRETVIMAGTQRSGRSAVRGWRLAMLGLAVVLMLGGPARAQSPRPVVYLAPIEGMIDLGLAPFVRRVLDEAAAAGAAAVILEINTFGGRVDAAVLIRDALLEQPHPDGGLREQARHLGRGPDQPRRRADRHGRRRDDRGGHPRGARRARRAGAARGGEDRVLHAQGVPRDRREPEAAAACSPRRWWTPMWRFPASSPRGSS